MILVFVSCFGELSFTDLWDTWVDVAWCENKVSVLHR